MHPLKDRHKYAPDRRGLHGLKQVTEDRELHGGSLRLLSFAVGLGATFPLGAGPTWKAQAEAPGKEKVEGGREGEMAGREGRRK